MRIEPRFYLQVKHITWAHIKHIERLFSSQNKFIYFTEVNSSDTYQFWIPSLSLPLQQIDNMDTLAVYFH